MNRASPSAEGLVKRENITCSDLNLWWSSSAVELYGGLLPASLMLPEPLGVFTRASPVSHLGAHAVTLRLSPVRHCCVADLDTGHLAG